MLRHHDTCADTKLVNSPPPGKSETSVGLRPLATREVFWGMRVEQNVSIDLKRVTPFEISHEEHFGFATVGR